MPPAEREAALRELLEDPDALEQFVETARLRLEFADRLDEISAMVAAAAASQAAPAKAATAPRWPRWWIVAPIAAAALLALLVARMDSPRDTPLLELATLVRAPGAGALPLPPDGRWVEPDWTVVRGENAAAGTLRSAFRYGVLLASLRIAVDWRQPEAAALTARLLASRLRSISGGGPLAIRLETVAATVPPGRGQRDATAEIEAVAREMMEGSAAPEWIALGIWTGLARLALLSGNQDFFAPRSPAAGQLTRLMDSLDNEPAPGAEEYRTRVLSALRSLRETILTGSPDPAIPDGVSALIAAAG